MNIYKITCWDYFYFYLFFLVLHDSRMYFDIHTWSITFRSCGSTWCGVGIFVNSYTNIGKLCLIHSTVFPIPIPPFLPPLTPCPIWWTSASPSHPNYCESASAYRENIQCLVFWDWLISLSMIVSSSICLLTNATISFFFMAE